MGHDWSLTERRRKRAEIAHRMESIRTAVAPRDWNGVRVVIIDDAAVAPWTLAAAAEAARLRGAAHIVVAVPFASVAVCDELTRHAHLVVAAVAPQHPVRSALEIYRAFPHVTFGEMMEKLKNSGVRTRTS